MPRTIIVGDIHGCADELGDLLDLVALEPADQLICVGDLIGRGPHPHRTLRVARQAGAKAVRGNHEEHFLRSRQGKTGRSRPPSPNERRRLEHAARLDGDDWAFLEALPWYLELPEHDAVVVHAGLEPGVPIDNQQPRVLITLRTLTEQGEPSAKREGIPWASRYEGPPHVVFGHHALPEPQIHPWATGLDTGCVYGGRLTALVLDESAAVPVAEDRLAAVHSVPARRTYEPIS